MSDFLQRWPITALQKGLLSSSHYNPLYAYKRFLHGNAASVLELGALFGALSAGILADQFSRRYSICLACSKCEGTCPWYPDIETKGFSNILRRFGIPVWSPISYASIRRASYRWCRCWRLKVPLILLFTFYLTTQESLFQYVVAALYG